MMEKIIDEASPSTPVEILGMNDSVYAGAEFTVVNNEDEAKEISKYNKENLNEKNRIVSLDKAKLFEKADNKRELNIIIKSDVQGSREALKMAIDKITHEEVKPNIILSDIGMINETDVSLAKASDAILIGFNVKPNREAKKMAEGQKIDISYFNIIYKALEFIEKNCPDYLILK